MGEIKADLRGVRDTDIKGIRDRQDRDFIITWGGIIAAALALAAMMAKGFRWF